MYCGNCGTENTSDARFCRECGKPLENEFVQEEQVVQKTPGPSPDENKQAEEAGVSKKPTSQWMERIKRMPARFLIGAGAAVVLIIAIVCFWIISGNTIKLDKYIVMETHGYNGYGTADISINWDEIEKKYGSKLSFTDAARSEYGEFIKMTTPMEVFQGYVRVSLEKNQRLSNGDSVAYTWDVDEDLYKYIDCKVKYKDDTVSISGLEEIDTFDAFKNLEVEFSGVSPNGVVNLNYTGDDLSTQDFICDTSTGLSNGDTLVVSINDNKVEYYAEQLGKVPEEPEKEYKVEGLDHYLEKLDEIDSETLKSLQQKASEVYQEQEADSWGDGESLQSFSAIGEYLLTPKNEGTWGNQNQLILVCKARVKNTYSSDEDKYDKENDIYWYIGYDNLVVTDDGTVSVELKDYSTPYHSMTIDSGISDGWWGTRSWYYNGYESLDDLYQDVVVANNENYNYEERVDEKTEKEIESSKAAEEEQDYILPDSDKELLKEDDLKGLSAEECSLARNEIYARHGRKFKDKELQEYFESKDWYKGTIEPDDFEESTLSEIEKENAKIISNYEKEQGYR